MGRLIKWSLIVLFLLVLVGIITDKLRQKFPSASAHDSDAKVASGLPGMQRSGSAGNWTISLGRSSFDDSPTVQLELRANTAIVGWPGRKETPTLVARCLEHKTELFVHTGLVPSVEYGLHDLAAVRLRLDSDPATIALASKSTDGRALFLSQPAGMIQVLATHRRMILGFTPFNSPAVETDFDLDGLAEAAKTLRAACPAD